MSLRYVPLLATTISAVLLLGACASPTAGPAPDEPSQATVDEIEEVLPAVDCDELADEEVAAVTREFYTGYTPEQFDQILADCAANPNLSLIEVAVEVQRAASYLTALDQKFTVTDKEGYTFDLDVDLGVVSIEQDPASQPPGLTAALREVDLAMTITNTTAARELTFSSQSGITAPLSYPTLVLHAVYAADSPVCVAIRGEVRGFPCTWYMGFGRLEGNTTLAADAVLPLTTSGGPPNGGGLDQTWLTDIPEDQWPQVEESLRSPAGYAIAYGGGDYGRFADLCPGPSTREIIVTTDC